MITVALFGGMGNQLYQYAVGRSLAIDRDDILSIDKSYYYLYNLNLIPRRFELNHFNINVLSVHSSLFPLIRTSLLFRINEQKYFPQKIGNRKYIYDPYIYGPNGYNASRYYKQILEDKSSDYYLIGPWVYYDLFKHNWDVIQNECSVSTPPSNKNKKRAEQIANCEAVCLHVRRGDFVSCGIASGVSYYHEAIKYIIDNVDNPVFFVFSDDFVWTKKEIKIPCQRYYISLNNADSAYEDMRLISQCKYFITTNSSFGSMGALLSKFDKKLIIHPDTDGTPTILDWK